MKIKKKIKKEKSLEDRADFCKTIKAKIELLDLSKEIPEVGQLYDILDRYQETGQNENGHIMMPAHGRRIEYVLSKRAHIQNFVVLKAL